MLKRGQRRCRRLTFGRTTYAATIRVNAGIQMEHPVQYLTVVTKFLDRMIEEHGDRLFVAFGFVCLAVIAWILIRKRRHPVQDFRVVILPFGIAPRKETERLPEPFEDRSAL